METVDESDPFAVSALWPNRNTLVRHRYDEPLGLFSSAEADGKEGDESDWHLELPRLISDDCSKLGAIEPSEHPWKASFDLSLLEDDQEMHQLDPISDGSVFSADVAEVLTDDTIEPDIWELLLDDEPSEQGRIIFGWNQIADTSLAEPVSLYLSEAGSRVFDAALQSYELQKTPNYQAGSPMLQEPFFKALISLGLGRSSAFFCYDESTRRFYPVTEDARISGCSLKISRSLSDKVMRCGNLFRELRDFAEQAYRSSTNLPAVVALATVVDTSLSAYEHHIYESVRLARTFLQLDHIFSRPGDILGLLQALITVTRNARSNADVASKVSAFMAGFDHISANLRRLFCAILSRVSQPWLEETNASIGLTQGTNMSREGGRQSLTTTQEGQVDVETDVVVLALPDFVDERTVKEISRVSKSLDLLRRHDVANPLCSFDSHRPITQLELTFDMAAVERTAAKAAEYMSHICSSVSKVNKTTEPALARTATADPKVLSTGYSKRDSGFSWTTFNREVSLELPEISAALPYLSAHEQTYQAAKGLFEERDTTDVQSVDLDAVTMFSLPFLPLLIAQARLVNASVLRLLFQSYQLRAHLELQYRFHLMGDGNFVAQLASALFDPSRATAERERGVLRTGESMRLRLGARNTWPPASSELQLALMGILSQCFGTSPLAHNFPSGSRQSNGPKDRVELPGSLSFSVRQLPEADAERCMKADSLFALDFLRLYYQPASPVDAIITSTSLDKYDAIFKALLRLRRMLFVTSKLPSRGLPTKHLRLRFVMTHVVTTCCSHFFNNVTEAWHDFGQKLDMLSEAAQTDDFPTGLKALFVAGLEDVKEAHESYLNRILISMFLRKRHAHILSLLEEIFGLVLNFATLADRVASGDSSLTSDDDTVMVMNATFRDKTRAFVDACRSFSGVKGSSTAQAEDQRRGIERLLLSLNWNEHYASS